MDGNTKGTLDFRENILRALTFAPERNENFTLYRNISRPELGYCLYYERPGYYNLGIADYTIAHDFELPFSHDSMLMRFGIFYAGQTEYQIEGQPVSFTTPSSFFVTEKSLSGVQRWRRGQHYHGTEITVDERYFDEVLKPLCPNVAQFRNFKENYTYHYLPEEIIQIINQMAGFAADNRMTLLYLESKILECFAILTEIIRASPDNAFTFQLDYGNVPIGQSRKLQLTPADMRAIHAARDILSRETHNPPTISELSRRVFLNEQKLKAGFAHHYHTPIGRFAQNARMSKAANLLATTNLSIDEIARLTGYQYSGNFARMFRKIYGDTPLQFRMNKKISK